ncbi:MAG: serine hydrolase [Bythopirellula sp.]|nr:serine hydrolase [Bythopirellula sp.]
MNQKTFSRVLYFMVAIGCVSSSTASRADELANRLQPLIDNFAGKAAVMVKNLETGETFAFRADEPFPTASLIKFPVMIAAYDAAEKKQLALDDTVTLHNEDKVPGSGILTSHFADGVTMPLSTAIQLMIAYSDNTATNLVIDAIGIETTNTLMKSLGCENTLLNSKVYRRDTSIAPERSNKYGLGSTTAADMVKLLELLQSNKLVSESASKHMLAHMLACQDRTKIVRLLPPGTQVAHKTGEVSASRTDAGLIASPAGSIAVCVLTDEIEDRRSSTDNAADLLCSNIAKEAYDYFNQGKNAESGPPIVRLGATGLLVESLQRMLNARLDPSPEIGVDGDFGSQTQQALLLFQRINKLPETGEVGPDTWAALGTLVSEEEAPDPAVVNTTVSKKEPLEILTGPPVTTCKAWAIGDAETGKLLWGLNDAERRDIASTTKIMTAYLVTILAEKHPEVLDEMVVFSERADTTTGSTAGVRVGEKIPVRELLYGLLLPSGNDAAVALAEHFGERLGKSDKEGADSYDHFIAAMNDMAKELNMDATDFRNPNGLPEEGHQSSAADLLKLSHAAMQQPLFRDVVATPQHGCTVEGAEGYKRNLFWKNTNQLLGTTGYDGIKTGTTSAAGACLVSQGTRDGKSLIVVVLGATSSDGRYVDARNLYRWAWQELGVDSATKN